jgi:hypothetical protein
MNRGAPPGRSLPPKKEVSMKRAQSSRLFLALMIEILAATVASAATNGPIPSKPAAGDGWVQLGTSHVDGPSDHDKIEVGAARGGFQKLKFEVQGPSVKFNQVVVHFEDGHSKSLPTSFVVADHASSRGIGLPRKSPAIDSVELWYERKAGGSRPEVILLGRTSALTVSKATTSPGIASKNTQCRFQQFCSVYRELLLEANPKRLAEIALILNSLFQGLLEAGIGPELPYRDLLLLLSQLADQGLHHARAQASVAKPATPVVAPVRVLFHLALQHGSSMVAIYVYLESPVAGLGPLLDFVHAHPAGK